MRKGNKNKVAVLKLDGNILGTVTLKHLINNILAKNILPSDTIEQCCIRIYPKVDINTGHLGLVSRILEKDSYVVVTESNGAGSSKTEKPLGVIGINDLYEYISHAENKLKYEKILCSS